MTTTPDPVKGVPRIEGNPAPTLRADHNALADYVFDVANRKAGTAAERNALTGSDVWPGLEFYETDSGATYLRTATNTWKLVSDFTMAIPTGAALPQNGTDTAAPPVGTPLQMKLQYVQVGTNGSGVAASKILFGAPFPNACLGVWPTTISGSSQSPVVESGRVDRLGFFPTWPASPNVTVRFVYLAIGW